MGRKRKDTNFSNISFNSNNAHDKSVPIFLLNLQSRISTNHPFEPQFKIYMSDKRPKTALHSGSTLIYHLQAILAVSAWGASFISTKVLLQNGLNAVEIYVYRILLAYLLTMCICPRPFRAHSLKDELMFLLCGTCGGSIYFIAENTAMLYTMVSNVALITTLAPLITALIVATLYRTEHLSKGVIIGSFIALAGVGCVIFNSSVVVKVNPVGDLLALGAAICWAVYTVVLRPLNAVYTAWFITRKTFFYGLVTAIPFLIGEGTGITQEVLMQPAVWCNLLFLGIVCSMLAYVLWAQTIKHLGAIKGGNYLYLSPLVTLILSAIVLGERVSLIGYVGCALILAGVILGDKIGRSKRGDSTTSQPH